MSLMRAIVVANDDPEKRGRVKLAIPDLFLDATDNRVIDSPWCDAKGGCASGGWLDVPEIGSHVWVQPQYHSADDVFDLVYERGMHGTKGDQSNAPATGQGVDDNSVRLKVSAPFKVPSPNSALERKSPLGTVTREASADKIDIQLPTSFNAGTYPHNKVLTTQGGFVLEVDTTPGAERLQLHHPSGTGLEIGASGTWVQRATKRFEEILEHDVRRIGGDLRERVDGHETRSIGGNQVVEVSNRSILLAGEVNVKARFDMLMEVGGQFRQRVAGVATQRFLSDWNVVCGGGAAIKSAGNFSILSALGSTTIAGVQGVNLAGAMCNIAAAHTTIISPSGVDILAVPGVGLPVVIMNDALISLLNALIAHTHPASDTRSPELVAVSGATAKIVSPVLRAQGVL